MIGGREKTAITLRPTRLLLGLERDAMWSRTTFGKVVSGCGRLTSPAGCCASAPYLPITIGTGWGKCTSAVLTFWITSAYQALSWGAPSRCMRNMARS